MNRPEIAGQWVEHVVNELEQIADSMERSLPDAGDQTAIGNYMRGYRQALSQVKRWGT